MTFAESMERVVEYPVFSSKFLFDFRFCNPLVMLISHDAKHLSIALLLNFIVEVIPVVGFSDFFETTAFSERAFSNVIHVDFCIRISGERTVAKLLDKV